MTLARLRVRAVLSCHLAILSPALAQWPLSFSVAEPAAEFEALIPEGQKLAGISYSTAALVAHFTDGSYAYREGGGQVPLGGRGSDPVPAFELPPCAPRLCIRCAESKSNRILSSMQVLVESGPASVSVH
jgi:hypothetical protein